MNLLSKIRWTLYGKRRRMNALMEDLERIRVSYRLTPLERTSKSSIQPAVRLSGNIDR
ncbi:hypothetical protein [Alicyclobacillus ferrooxydans]|uniref:hypothetical protein n=1 Tax=Alicyclobacillus ferrooxydans TaxID=471514 RepID=UPI000A7D71D7|nr:hypothetical protein [Alicyclobacillus ferrooxydans]